MRRPATRLWQALAGLCLPLAAQAENPSTQLSLEGFSGFGSIPHAQTQPSGQLSVGYSDLSPTVLLADTSATVFALGLFERLELSGRLLEGPALPTANSVTRDLAAGLKLQLFRHEGWPSLAVGAQDVQGNRLFPSEYAVTSWLLGPVQLSAGYGWESENLEGGFGGIEWRPASWFAASAEHSAGGNHLALRLSTPPFYGIRLGVLAAHNFDDDGETNLGVELSLPLAGARAAPATPVPAATAQTRAAAPVTPPSASPIAPSASVADAPRKVTLCVQDAWPGRSAAAALGAAVRQARGRIPENASSAAVVLVRDGAPALSTEVTPQSLSGFFAGGDGAAPATDFAESDACHNAAPATPNPRPPFELVLEPNLVSFVGTEYGVIDADLALRARFQLPLYGSNLGLLVSALTPSVHTHDFDDGKNFEFYRAKPGVDQGLLQWYGRPASSWHALTSVGHLRLLQDDMLALLQEHVYYFNQGRDSLRAHYGLLRQDDGTGGFVIGEIAHHFVKYGTTLALAGGRFAAGDNGGRLELTRYFGNTAITVFAKSAGSGNESAGGMRISFPLGGRLESDSGGIVIRGSERWSHSVQSTLGDDASGNALRPNLLVEPTPDRNLRESYLDMDRATPAWIDAHAAELLEGYRDQ